MTSPYRLAFAFGSVLAAAMWSAPALAQDQPYNCVNESKRINIPAQRLDRALDMLSRQTNCPISRVADIEGVRGQRVRGTFTPEQALKALVRGTGLEGISIRQGLSVTGEARRPRPVATAPYDCQNVSIRLDIPQMRMDRALDALSRRTRCPISRDFEVSGLLSRPLRGTYTPLAGLRAMLEGTGLRGQPIRQGLTVLPVA